MKNFDIAGGYQTNFNKVSLNLTEIIYNVKFQA